MPSRLEQKNFQRRRLSAQKDSHACLPFAQCWTLDSTGNWQGFREVATEAADRSGRMQAEGGSPRRNGTWDLIQARTVNKVNEITDISETAGPSWVTPVYSATGNMTTISKPNNPTQGYSATYDAWNRLVQIADGSDTVSQYAYDGVRRRIIQKSYTSGTLSETRHLYYTQPNQWQVIEERLGTSTDAERQFVWGLRYIDDCVLRDRDKQTSTPTEEGGESASAVVRKSSTLDQRLYACQDANWNVTALVDAVGDVQERDAYSAYGVPLFLTPTFGTRAASTFDWETLYCGYRYENTTGLFHVRNRAYHPILGSWLQRDPLAAHSFNLYEYCESQPPMMVDSSGEVPAATAPPIVPIPRPKPGPGIPPGWTPTPWPIPGAPPAPAGCSAPAVPPPGTGLPPTVQSCIGYWIACRAGNALGCNAFWACMNGGADPANSCVRACLQTVGFPPPAVPGPVPPGAGFPATSPNCWCNYLQHLACFSACGPRAPGVAVPPWNIGGAGFNWCTFQAVCLVNLTPTLNKTPWTTYPVPPCRWPTVAPPIGGPPGPCIMY